MRTPPRVMPALITPFDDDEAIDLDAHRFNVTTLWERGVAGVVLGGSNGEGPYLDPGERFVLTAAAREAAPDAFVMTGIAAESVRAAEAAAREAERGGADAVLAMTPTTLVRHRPHLVEGFYRDLADGSPLPVFLYSVPRVTAYELPMDSAIALSEHENIAGMKDSGGDHVRGATIAARAADGFVVFIGASAAVSPGVAGGAHGAITASANYAAGLVGDVVTAAMEHPDQGLHEQLLTLSGAVEQFGVPGVKLAAQHTGLRPGRARRPLAPLSQADAETVISALHTAGIA